MFEVDRLKTKKLITIQMVHSLYKCNILQISYHGQCHDFEHISFHFELTKTSLQILHIYIYIYI